MSNCKIFNYESDEILVYKLRDDESNPAIGIRGYSKGKSDLYFEATYETDRGLYEAYRDLNHDSALIWLNMLRAKGYKEMGVK